MHNAYYALLLSFVLLFQLAFAAPLVNLRISSLGYQHYRGQAQVEQHQIQPTVEQAYEDMKTANAAEWAHWQTTENHRRQQWAQTRQRYEDDCRRADRNKQRRPQRPVEPRPARRPIDLPAMMSGLYYHGVLYLSSSAKRSEHGIPYPSDFPTALKTAMDDCKAECGSSHRHGGACSEPMAWAYMVGIKQMTALPEKGKTAIATFGQGPLDVEQNRAAHPQNPCADTNQGSGCRTLMKYVGSVIIKKRELTSSVHGMRATNANAIAERDWNGEEMDRAVRVRASWNEPFRYEY